MLTSSLRVALGLFPCQVTVVWIHHGLFSHFPIDGHFSYFYCFITVEGTALHVCTHLGVLKQVFVEDRYL